MNKKITFGIIGCRRIAERHAGHIQHLGQLVAVCDIQPEKAKALGGTLGAAFYESHQEMLEAHPELDVVAICSPNGLHADTVLIRFVLVFTCSV